MGVIQQSINSALSSVTQTAAISKAATELSKKNELEKLNAESEYLKNKSEIQKEIGELDKFKEESKIASEKANQELESANKGVSGAEDIVGMLPNDPEARKILRESQEKADLAKATAEARKREKLNNYKYIRERKEFLTRQSELATKRAKAHGLDVNKLKGGSK